MLRSSKRCLQILALFAHAVTPFHTWLKPLGVIARPKLPHATCESTTDVRIEEIGHASLPHAAVRDWVVFSDLHVSERSLDTSLEVLRSVHAVAKRRSGGLIFLGDFWHVRGTLPIRILNKVLAELATWTQPVIMIPGNHDQLTLGGDVHALTPLSFALRRSHPQQAIVVERPSLFLGALFVPYLRDSNLLASVLRSSAAAQASAVFVHADVTGASMNDGSVVRRGVSPLDFPDSGVPLVSGHFHKPHTVARGGRAVRYVGSPWEVGLAEAGQAKAALIYRCEENQRGFSWTLVDSHPLRIGPRHFKALAGTAHGNPWIVGQREDKGAVEDDGRDIIFTVPLSRPLNQGGSVDCSTPIAGDRVIVDVFGAVGDAARAQIQGMRQRGVLVELRRAAATASAHEGSASSLSILRGLSTNSIHLPSAAAETPMGWPVNDDGSAAGGPRKRPQLPGGAPLESLSPRSIFKTYLAHALNASGSSGSGAQDPDGDEAALRSALRLTALGVDGFEEGLGILEECGCFPSDIVAPPPLLTQETAEGSRGAGALRLESVELERYGPFKDRVAYPLANRGFVLLTGANSDVGPATSGGGVEVSRPGASNGAGKSSLAMAALWCLTGKLDPRPGSGEATDVVYHAPSEQPRRVGGAKAPKKQGGRLGAAEVTVRGYTASGAALTVTRRRVQSGGSKLTVAVGGKDISCQVRCWCFETLSCRALDPLLGLLQ